MSNERRSRIVKLVNSNGYMSLEDLGKELNVSQSTLRTDLDALDKDQQLIRLRGVAISKYLKGSYIYEGGVGDNRAYLADRLIEEEKQAIAQSCLRLLTLRDAVFLDTSNTNYVFAQLLADTPQLFLSVLTNSLDIFQQLRSCNHINTVLTGGDYESSTNSLVGEHAIRFIEGFYANYAFITARGFDPQLGVGAYYSRNTAVRRAMSANSANTVVVSDHSKFDNVGVEIVCPWNQVDYLVTDLPLGLEYQNIVTKNNIRLILPE